MSIIVVGRRKRGVNKWQKEKKLEQDRLPQEEVRF
jgi:hypothetical protein